MIYNNPHELCRRHNRYERRARITLSFAAKFATAARSGSPSTLQYTIKTPTPENFREGTSIRDCNDPLVLSDPTSHLSLSSIPFTNMAISMKVVPKAVLYYDPHHVWSSAVRLALEEKGYGDDEVDFKMVDLAKGQNFFPSFLRLNPKGPASPVLLFYMNTRDSSTLQSISKTVLPFLRGQCDALDRYLSDNKSSSISISEKTKTFWLEKKRVTEELLIMMSDAGKADAVLRGSMTDNGADAIRKLERHVVDGFRLPKDAFPPSSQVPSSEGTTLTNPVAQAKLSIIWDNVKERLSWKKSAFGTFQSYYDIGRQVETADNSDSDSTPDVTNCHLWMLVRSFRLEMTCQCAALDEAFKAAAYAWETLADPATRHSGDPSASPFARAFNTKQTLWQFHEWAEESYRNHPFGVGMQGVQAMQPVNAILDAYNWASLPAESIVIDVGGGIGTSSFPLAEKFSTLKIVVQDLLGVVKHGKKVWEVKMPDKLKSGAVHDFFDRQLQTNASIFLLKQITHDWSDEYCVKFLTRLQTAATSTMILLIVDSIMPFACHDPSGDDDKGIPDAVPHEAPVLLLANFSAVNEMAYNADIDMFLLFNSQERMICHFDRLLRNTGWKIKIVHHQADDSTFLQSIEAVPIV
ncbi:hypothetical protein EW146_g8366 [Bondarzewia mesenterica]|uniref:O-methyltransferase C-terminal domain-containing protein n=1 Tax=Bondarzewia mesenterica TaxID=1095465 RepID=A0A4S4LFJ7_9AGAM|nr:hypothetical protein EW146_g8366 [Bondarzewia mesenterica]